MAPVELGIDDVFFEYDSYTLSEEAMAILEASSGIFKNYGDFLFVIEGHCDERGTVEYNLALGEKRSIAVRDYLITLGVDRTKLRITSYGEERPFAHGSDESAWSLNRRVHFARP
ncbi:MAG: OmpA family protein [bacterium]|nr:OmpA family protein [bacterium]MCP4799047.1 OmpA family protein [bacterium]